MFLQIILHSYKARSSDLHQEPNRLMNKKMKKEEEAIWWEPDEYVGYKEKDF